MKTEHLAFVNKCSNFLYTTRDRFAPKWPFGYYCVRMVIFLPRNWSPIAVNLCLYLSLWWFAWCRGELSHRRHTQERFNGQSLLFVPVICILNYVYITKYLADLAVKQFTWIFNLFLSCKIFAFWSCLITFHNIIDFCVMPEIYYN